MPTTPSTVAAECAEIFTVRHVILWKKSIVMTIRSRFFSDVALK